MTLINTKAGHQLNVVAVSDPKTAIEWINSQSADKDSIVY